MKDAEVYSLRTQEAIARFGNAARHPLCQAWLSVQRLRKELLELARDSLSFGKNVLDRAKQLREQTHVLLIQFRKERKKKEAQEAAQLLRNVDVHLAKAQAQYDAKFRVFTTWHDELLPAADANFERELDAIGDARNFGALKDLQIVKRRWQADEGKRLKSGRHRTLGILQLLHRRVISGIWAKDGAAAAYWEAASGGDRLLSDEVWQWRLTVREFHSRLTEAYGHRVAGDKGGKEIRRTLNRLGIRWAEDQRGRKRKAPYPKTQRPRKPLGRPRKVELVYVDTDIAQALQIKEEHGIVGPKIYRSIDEQADLVRDEETADYEIADRISEQQDFVRQAKQDQEAIGREIARLTRRRQKLRLEPTTPPKRTPEGTIKGRSDIFAAFLDS